MTLRGVKGGSQGEREETSEVRQKFKFKFKPKLLIIFPLCQKYKHYIQIVNINIIFFSVNTDELLKI